MCSLLLSESLHHVCLPPGGWIAEVAWRRGVKFEVVSDELCSVLVESCFFPVIFQVAACPCSALAPSTSTTLCLSEQIKIFSKKLGRNKKVIKNLLSGDLFLSSGDDDPDDSSVRSHDKVY